MFALRDLGARYDLLENDGDTARALHAWLLKQQAETAVNAALTASNVRVLERPEVPQRSSAPNVPLNLTLGLLGGLVVAAGAAFACEYFDSSLESSDEVEELTGLPTLAVVPSFALPHRLASGRPASVAAPVGQRRTELVVAHEPWSLVAESFRTLRSRSRTRAGCPATWRVAPSWTTSPSSWRRRGSRSSRRGRQYRTRPS